MEKKGCEWGLEGGEWRCLQQRQRVDVAGVYGFDSGLWKAGSAGAGDLVDDLLDEDDLDVDAARDVWQELGNEVVGWGETPSGNDPGGSVG